MKFSSGPIINGLSNNNAKIIKLNNFKIQEQYNEETSMNIL
jgi:hypothetical protein